MNKINQIILSMLIISTLLPITATALDIRVTNAGATGIIIVEPQADAGYEYVGITERGIETGKSAIYSFELRKIAPIPTSAPTQLPTPVPTYTQPSGNVLLTFDDAHNQESLTLIDNVLSSNDQDAIIYSVTSLSNSMLPKYHELYDRGWDISSHTVSHKDLRTLNDYDLDRELKDSKSWLDSNGFTKSSSYIAYPYGSYDDRVISFVDNYYTIGRSVASGYESNINPGMYDLKVINVLNYMSAEYLQQEVNNAVKDGNSVILLFHHVSTTYSSNPYFYPEYNLRKLSDYLKVNNIPVRTFSDLLGNDIDPDPTPSPTPTPTPTTSPIPSQPNLIKNPTFNDKTSWNFWTGGIGNFNVINNEGIITLNSYSNNMQLYQSGLSLNPNTQYSLSFNAKSLYGSDLVASLINHGAPYQNYGLYRSVDLKSSNERYTITFKTGSEIISNQRLMFFFGSPDTYTISDAELIEY